MRKRRIRWGRVFITAAVVVGITAGAYQYITAPTTRLIEYQAEVKPGDTLWTICGKIATDKEDLRRLVWQAKKDNRIKDVGNLQPGMLIVVKVKEARNG
jgi:lysM domain protein